MTNLGLAELLILFVVVVFGIIGTIFWIWTLIDVATKEPNEGSNKVVWILVIIFTHWLGALVYLVVRRPQRIELYGR
jgi:hypothetical protein